MAGFVIRRLASMVLVLLTVSVLVFAVFNVIPNGDPAVRMAGQAPSDFEIQAIRQEWGFDEPVWVQYATMMRKLATADVVSYFTQTNVVEEIARGAPRTFSLAIGAALIWFGVGVLLGLVSAVRAGRATDRLITVLAVVGISVPAFWIGALANHYLGFRLGLFPNGGYVPLTENPLRWAYHLVLPWLTLALLLTGVYSRVLRTHLLDTSRRATCGPPEPGHHGAAGAPPPCPPQFTHPRRHALGGPRTYSLSVYAPSGRRILFKRGLASSAWRYFYFRPIQDHPGGVATYETVYRSPGFSRPAVYRTSVTCGE